MDYDHFINAIMSSDSEDWIYDSDLEKYIYTKDIRITIEDDISLAEEDLEEKRFHEEWVKKYADSTAYKKWFLLCFNGNCIKRFHTVAVDGYRAYIPYPRIKDMTISSSQYRIGLILSIAYSANFDEYLTMGSIQVGQ